MVNIRRAKSEKKEKTEKEDTTQCKDIDMVLALIDKKYGKGTAYALKDAPVFKVDVIPTGSYLLDRALVIGGFPRGRIVEIFGVEGCGKTACALHAIAAAQKMGEKAAFIDAEHSLDINLARAYGVNTDDLIINQPDNAEQALEIMEMLVSSKQLAIIALDSVAALVPKAELDGEMGDSHMGLQARLMGQALRKLTGIVAKSNTCVIFINQLRMKIGVMFGNPETTSGGNALKFYSSIRLDMRKLGVLKRGEEVIGHSVKIKVVKNKLAAPYREAETEFIFGKGFNKEAEVLDIAVEHEIIDVAGSWHSYKEDKIGQGKAEACKFLKAHPEIVEEIWKEIKVIEEKAHED